MKIAFTSIVLVLLNGNLHAQDVRFTPHDTLLQRITGFANYADCVVDMNGDYLDDVVRIGNKGVFIDYQQEDGTFEGRQFNFSIESPPGWSICAGDLDNNGYNDLLLANSNAVSFVRANASGNDYREFLMPGHIESQRSTIQDINRDGWLDAFVCHESGRSIPYRNAGDGTMSPDSTLLPTANLPGNYAAIWTDYDQDRDADLYISKCLAGAPVGDPVRTNLLYRNNGDNTYTEIAASANLDDNAQSWSTVFEDFDLDGDMDAFIVNHDMANRLFRNNGDGTFTDVIAASGINATDLGAFENSSGDFNNDGHMDIFAELASPLYLGNGDLTFAGQKSPVTPGAIGDLNNDGFPDVVRENRVWLNDGNDNHYVILQTLGLVSNRSGIGAIIEVHSALGKQTREVRSGQSFSPMSSLNTYVGLGTDNHIDSVIVYWPSGMVTRMKDLNTDTTYLIPEVTCVLPPVYLDVVSTLYLCPFDTLDVFGPPGFVDYWWSNGDTSATLEVYQEGTYYAIVTDTSGCTGITNFFKARNFIERDPEIRHGFSLDACAGDTMELSSNEILPWTWSTGDTTATIGITAAGWYSLSIPSTCDSTKSLYDSVFVSFFASEAPVPNDPVLITVDSVLLTAQGNNIHWYDEPAGGSLLHIGNSYTVSTSFADSIFYLEAHQEFGNEIQYGGKPDTTGGGGLPGQSGSLLFTADRPFTLETVDVYVPEGGPAGVRFVQLLRNDSLIASKQFTLTDGLNVLQLDFDVMPGEYELRTPQGNLYRNTANVHYPYPIGTVGSITGSAHGDRFYYDFYNWRIRTATVACTSVRIPYQVIISATTDLASIGIRLYPNPARESLLLEHLPGQQILSASIHDLHGRFIKTVLLEGRNRHVISLDGMAEGLYMLRVVGSDFTASSAFAKL